MILGVKAWALAHPLSNGRPGGVALLGAFLAWAIPDYRAARRCDKTQGTTCPATGVVHDAIVVAIGLAAWPIFARNPHRPLIGLRPPG